MPAPFPHHYVVSLAAHNEGAVLRSGTRPPILGGAPAEFDGREDWWSPEHLLLSSLSLCLRTTLEALAARAGLTVSGYRSQAEAVLEKTPGGLGFTSITLKVELEVPPAEVERAQQLLLAAKKHCIVSNSLKPSVNLEASVLGQPVVAASSA
jgi:organic hydroperoxide reductase OsmC/OhrA